MKHLYTILMLAGIITGAGAQSLQSVNPNSATIGTMTFQVEISGSNLNFNQGTNTQVIFSSKASGYEIYGYNFSSSSSSAFTTIDIAFPADTGLYDLTINNDNNTLVLNNAFTVHAELPATPTMSISPNSGSFNGTTTVTVSGHLTHFTDNAFFYIELPGQANYLGGQVLQITDDSTATVSFSPFGGLVPGPYNFYVEDNFDNVVLSVNQFVIQGSFPQIVSANPDSAAANQDLQVSISGVNTNFTSATSTDAVWLDKDGFIIFPLTSYISSDNFIVNEFGIPANAPDGYYDVHTFDYYDGELVKKNGFYIYGGVNSIEAVKADIISLQLFPNPATGQVTLVPNLLQEQWVNVSISDITGQVITTKRVFMAAGKSEYAIDVSLFASGMYIVNLNAGGQQLRNQFVVAH